MEGKRDILNYFFVVCFPPAQYQCQYGKYDCAATKVNAGSGLTSKVVLEEAAIIASIMVVETGRGGTII